MNIIFHDHAVSLCWFLCSWEFLLCLLVPWFMYLFLASNPVLFWIIFLISWSLTLLWLMKSFIWSHACCPSYLPSPLFYRTCNLWFLWQLMLIFMFECILFLHLAVVFFLCGNFWIISYLTHFLPIPLSIGDKRGRRFCYE